MKTSEKHTFFMHSDRLAFAKWQPHDQSLAKQIWANRDVCAFICAKDSFTDDEIAARLQLEQANDNVYHMQYWPIFLIEDGTFIGCCGLRPFPLEIKTAEIGCHLQKAYWNRGYSTEAMQKVIAYAFEVLDCKRIIAGHHPENTASKKVLKKLGFHYIGLNYYQPTGLRHPSYELYKKKK